MPRTYSWTTSFWRGDVDPFGELHTARVLRFLQETAHRASTDGGYDDRYYERTDRTWLVRRNTVSFLAPIRAGREMVGRTWVAEFRRVRSRRDYEIRVGDRLVTRASTDWVFADRSQGRLRRIPAEMEATFRPEGHTGQAQAPFPTTTPPPDAMRFARRVEAHELDGLNHVNNANYARYVEQAVLDVLTAHGWPLERQLAAGGRLRRATHDLEYLTPALYGDRIETLVWPHAVDDTSVDCTAWITRPDAVRPLLRAQSRYVWTPTAPTSSVESPMTMPAALRRALAGARA